MIRYVDLTADTICAPITGSGRAGVSVVRVSGGKTLSIIEQCIQNSPLWDSHHIYLRDFSYQGVKIDQVLISYFREGQSFTGDEVVEISCHGNPLIVQRIIEVLIALGCRMAEPGEFSFRAFYNGKIDLTQAESIHGLIMSTNSRANVNQNEILRGQLTNKLNQADSTLIRILAELEASIDFPEEDLEFSASTALVENLKAVTLDLVNLADTYSTGKSLDKGHKVLLLGATNVGKSSLFNMFSGEDRAIVTDIPGTTRDLLHGQVFIGSFPVEFVDSAGLRESHDEVEKLGIEKGKKEIDRADLVLYVVDGTSPVWPKVEDLPLNKTQLVLNKVDLLSDDQRSELLNGAQEIIHQLEMPPVLVSAKSGYYIDKLQNQIESYFSQQVEDTSSKVLITQARHFRHLSTAIVSLQTCAELLDQGESPDIISQEAQVALSEIHRILGKEYDDEILDQIFSQFCIGK